MAFSAILEGVSQLLVRPAGPLHGEVTAHGAKNAVLKQMAACLVAAGRHELHNVPRISDVTTMAELLRALGCTVTVVDHTAVIDVPEELITSAPTHLVEAMRASIVVLGPLVARAGRAEMSMPGGDDFGSRPINFHTDGLRAMGAEVSHDGSQIVATSPLGRLRGSRFVLEYPSHTATDNLLMAAVLADGRTVIDNAAREPEVEDLGRHLLAMGAQIDGLGTSRLVIEGVARLSPAHHTVIPDRVVAATYLAAGLITSGEVTVTDARADHMENLLRKFTAMGAQVDTTNGIRLRGPATISPVDVATLPYPGVATDYKPLITTVLSVAAGVSVVTENLFDGRFKYVDELVKMGAVIETDGHHAVVHGVSQLQGTHVEGSDIRAVAALTLAGLVARGETLIDGAHHVDRGYDDFVGRLNALGARVERVR